MTDENKVKDIIQFADLDTKSVHIINQTENEVIILFKPIIVIIKHFKKKL